MMLAEKVVNPDNLKPDVTLIIGKSTVTLFDKEVACNMPLMLEVIGVAIVIIGVTGWAFLNMPIKVLERR